MRRILLALIYLTSSSFLECAYVSPYPPCASTTFDYLGFIDVGGMLTNCSKNIPLSLDPPR